MPTAPWCVYPCSQTNASDQSENENYRRWQANDTDASNKKGDKPATLLSPARSQKNAVFSCQDRKEKTTSRIPEKYPKRGGLNRQIRSPSSRESVGYLRSSFPFEIIHLLHRQTQRLCHSLTVSGIGLVAVLDMPDLDEFFR